jgi:hypothetical protein
MKTNIFLFSILITILLSSLYFSEPGFNGTAPGCEGSGCHDQRVGIVSAVTNGLDVEITVMGSESGEPVAGELVDENGDVVDFINVSNDTTFTLTAPSEGTFLVNGGYKKPDREWDSVSVVIALTGVGGTTEPISTYKLYSNYPNPFNPSTKIKYLVAEKTFVSLKIYDVAGSEVASIVNREQVAGEYEIDFNASNLTSGVYFYKLQAGNFVETKKMILMK